MNLTESVFDSDGNKVGDIVMHSETGALDFLPRDGYPTPPGRPWRDLDDLKARLRAVYGPPGTRAAALERAAGLRGEPRKVSGHGTG